MRYSGKQKVHPGIRARDLPALMELYELNYIQLRRLLPDLGALPERMVSRVEGALDLHLTIRERCKYTTTLHLTYHFTDRDGRSAAPDIVVRMYHDAQVAEVLSRGPRNATAANGYDRQRRDYPLATKWQINRFLHKWLGYCLLHGHRFLPCSQESANSLQDAEKENVLSLES